jgi:hypothetical protein
MHYVTHRSHRMQKHKFGVMCPGALFVKSVSVQPEHEKECINVSWPGPTGMHYMTRISHRMQKTQVEHNVCWCSFCQIRISPTRV